MVKRKIQSLIVFSIVLGCYSCNSDENVSPENANNTSSQVAKLTLDGIGVRDSLFFSYQEDKIKSVTWCTSLVNDDCALEYAETRVYNETGKLTSLDGRWKISFEYVNDLRKSISAFYNNQYHSTTTFLRYDGIYPSRLKVENATDGIRYVDLIFNDDGDLTKKTIRDENEMLLEDVNITYSEQVNPLRGLLETPSYAVLFYGFDDFVFYFSKHFPDRVDIQYSQQNPIAPKRLSIDYQAALDEGGKIISAKAFRDSGQHTNAHNILIDYSN